MFSSKFIFDLKIRTAVIAMIHLCFFKIYDFSTKSLAQACFFNAFPPPCVPQIAEKLSLAKNSLSLAKKSLSLEKNSLSLAKNSLSLAKNS